MNPHPATHVSDCEPKACVIQESADYQTQLSLRPLEAYPNHVELLITSVWKSARDPGAQHVRFRAVLANEALTRLQVLLDRQVARQY
jgi:hypothetical protein